MPVDINSGKLSGRDVPMSIFVAYFKFVDVQVMSAAGDTAVNPIEPFMWTNVERSIVVVATLPNKLPFHLVIAVPVPVSVNEVTDEVSRM